jgi:hypothetical protein
VYTWKRFGGYEVSTQGDKNYSPFYARLSDGRTIEEAYQLDVKGYRKYGNDPMLGKGKPPLDKSKDLWKEYLALWELWCEENPTLLRWLKIRVDRHGKILSDRFANTPINQARALAYCLNRLYQE